MGPIEKNVWKQGLCINASNCDSRRERCNALNSVTPEILAPGSPTFAGEASTALKKLLQEGYALCAITRPSR